MRIDHVKPGIGFIAKRQSHTKTARGLLRMSNQYCCDMCNNVRNPLETDNPKELRHYINLNAQWIVKLQNILDNQVHEIESLRYQFDSLKEQVDRIELR